MIYFVAGQDYAIADRLRRERRDGEIIKVQVSTKEPYLCCADGMFPCEPVVGDTFLARKVEVLDEEREKDHGHKWWMVAHRSHLTTSATAVTMQGILELFVKEVGGPWKGPV
jgi:hypothetical protein